MKAKKPNLFISSKEEDKTNIIEAIEKSGSPPLVCRRKMIRIFTERQTKKDCFWFGSLSIFIISISLRYE
jgi:hypothetical protein